MNIQGTFKGQTYQEVTVENIPDETSVTDDFLVGWAMRAIGETPSRFFGWAVTRWPMTTTATVTLYTD